VTRAALGVALVALVAGAFLLGRHTAPNGSYQQGYDEGLSLGRALQAGDVLPADTKDVATKAFEAGNLGQPYAVVIGKGSAGATYRIESRELLQAGVAYQLCKHDRAVCRK
jgi:hypothetical protein